MIVSLNRDYKVVCHAAKENEVCVHSVSILTPRKKYNCVHIHSFMICFPNITKFAVEVTEYQERTHTRSKINCASHS